MAYLDSEFKELIKNNFKDYYCVVVRVYLSEDPNKIKDLEKRRRCFEDNKNKLEKYVKENNIQVYNPCEFSPNISLKMTGDQILKLAEENYVESISNGDKIIAEAV